MPRPLVDLSGQKFGGMTVIGLHAAQGNARWLCRCECGREKIVLGYNLRNGHTKSCGCAGRTGVSGVSQRMPGKTVRAHTEYRVWAEMLRRCRDERSVSYKHYGAKGIAVCERWNSFWAFLEDVGPRPTIKHTLDRIDGARGYEPGNCRWATWTEQARNRSNCRIETVFGVTACMSELCERFNVRRNTVESRLKAGKTLEEAFSSR